MEQEPSVTPTQSKLALVRGGPRKRDTIADRVKKKNTRKRWDAEEFNKAKVEIDRKREAQRREWDADPDKAEEFKKFKAELDRRREVQRRNADEGRA